MQFILHALQEFSFKQKSQIRKNPMLGPLSACSVLKAWRPQEVRVLTEIATGHYSFSYDQTQRHEPAEVFPPE